MLFNKKKSGVAAPAATNDYSFVEKSQNPRVVREKFDAAFDKAWKQIENEYADDQAVIRKTRKRYFTLAGIVFAIGAVLAIVGGVLYGTESAALSPQTAFIILIIGVVAAVLALFLGVYFVFKTPKTDATTKTTEKFVENFMTNYITGVWPDIVMQPVDLQNRALKARMSRSQCRVYEAAVGTSVDEMNCSVVQYLFATGDIYMMYGPGTFVQIDMTSNSRIALSYKGKQFSLFDAKVVRTEERLVVEGKTTRVEYYPVECFNGLIAATEFKIDYPYVLNVGAKRSFFSSSLRTGGLRKPEYELASDEFNRELDLRVSKEDGVALRKAFQPRMIAELCDISGNNTFELLRHSPNHSTAFYSRIGALALNSYSQAKFFKSRQDAYAMVNARTVPFFQLLTDVMALVASGFLI